MGKRIIETLQPSLLAHFGTYVGGQRWEAANIYNLYLYICIYIYFITITHLSQFCLNSFVNGHSDNSFDLFV